MLTARAARLTTGPEQSPSRASTSPVATPVRTGGSTSWAAKASTSASAMSAATVGSFATNITSSPMSLTTLPPRSTTISDEVGEADASAEEIDPHRGVQRLQWTEASFDVVAQQDAERAR